MSEVFSFFFFVFCCNLAKEGGFSICTVNKVTVFHWFQQMFCDRKWIAVKHELCLHQPFRGQLVVDGVWVPIQLRSSLFFKHTVFVTLTDALQPQGPKKGTWQKEVLRVSSFVLFFCVTLAAHGGDGAWRSPRPPEQTWERGSDCVRLPEDQSAVAVRRSRRAHVQVVGSTTRLFSASCCLWLCKMFLCLDHVLLCCPLKQSKLFFWACQLKSWLNVTRC